MSLFTALPLENGRSAAPAAANVVHRSRRAVVNSREGELIYGGGGSLGCTFEDEDYCFEARFTRAQALPSPRYVTSSIILAETGHVRARRS